MARSLKYFVLVDVGAHSPPTRPTPDSRTARIQTKRTGAAIVAQEAALDALYASGQATPSVLRNLLVELSRLQTEFRYAHLSAHLAMRAILTPTQIARYDKMRGYVDPSSSSEHPPAGASHGQHEHH